MLFVLGRCIMDGEEELAPGGEYDKTHEKSETESADNSNQISTTIIERLGSGSRNVQLLTDLEARIARLEKPGCGDELGPLRKTALGSSTVQTGIPRTGKPNQSLP